jgi:hypothetical protein
VCESDERSWDLGLQKESMYFGGRTTWEEEEEEEKKICFVQLTELL